MTNITPEWLDDLERRVGQPFPYHPTPEDIRTLIRHARRPISPEPVWKRVKDWMHFYKDQISLGGLEHLERILEGGCASAPNPDTTDRVVPTETGSVIALGHKAANGTIVVAEVLCANFPPLTPEQKANLSWRLDTDINFWKSIEEGRTPRDDWKKGEQVHILGGRDIWTIHADQDDDDVTLVNGHGVLIECDWARIRSVPQPSGEREGREDSDSGLEAPTPRPNSTLAGQATLIGEIKKACAGAGHGCSVMRRSLTAVCKVQDLIWTFEHVDDQGVESQGSPQSTDDDREPKSFDKGKTFGYGKTPQSSFCASTLISALRKVAPLQAIGVELAFRFLADELERGLE